MRSLFWRDKKRLVEFSNHWNHWLGNFIWPRKKFYREKIDKTKRRMWYLIHWMWLPHDVCGVFVDRCRIFRKSSTWFRTRSRKYVPSSLNQTIDNGKYFSPYLYHCKKLLFYNNQREIKLKKVGDTISSIGALKLYFLLAKADKLRQMSISWLLQPAGVRCHEFTNCICSLVFDGGFCFSHCPSMSIKWLFELKWWQLFTDTAMK